MAKVKRVPFREEELSTTELLSEVGLDLSEWNAYLAILDDPLGEHDPAPAVLEKLTTRGLLRPSAEPSFGYAPMPPGPAFTRLMEEHDEGLLKAMQEGIQLRKMLRTVSQGAAGSAAERSDGSGIEVHEDINEARDRIYELGAQHSERPQWNLETRSRIQSSDDRARSMTGAEAVDPATGAGQLHTAIADQFALVDESKRAFYERNLARGERVLRYPGTLIQLMLRDETYLVVWRDPFPSTSATLIVTTPWALRLARAYVDLVESLSSPWLANAAVSALPLHERVMELLREGLTDEQIATRTGMSTRTVGRYVAAGLDELGAATRFQAGVLLERRTQLAGSLMRAAGG